MVNILQNTENIYPKAHQQVLSVLLVVQKCTPVWLRSDATYLFVKWISIDSGNGMSPI